jgi:PAS domain S-box-containing protein
MKKVTSLPLLPFPEPDLRHSCESILAAMEDGVCIQNLDGKVLQVNEAFAAMMGLPKQNLIGQNCSEVFSCKDHHGELPHFCSQQKSLLSGEASSEEIQGRFPEQRLRARVSPIRDEMGHVTAFVMVVREITDVVAREKELARVEQVARFGELAAGLAHEIKNPLTGIQGAVDIMMQRRDAMDPEREVLENVRHEVGRIDRTIHSLLDRAKPREFNFQAVSLNETVHRAINLGRHQTAHHARQRGHQIQVEFTTAPTPIVMKIDADKIEDAILNLISNAIEAIETDGTISIHFSEVPQTNEVVIEIKDTGRGISTEDLQRIFSPFFTTNEKGTGLGLPAVQRIVRAHGGRVEVSSTVGEGSVFTLRFPRQSSA